MAHVEKYQIGAVGNMLGHYDRSTNYVVNRQNIDHAKTCLNYNLAPKRYEKSVEAVRAAVTASAAANGRKTRKDAVVLVDAVVTLPDGITEPEDSLLFFETVYDFLSERYGGEENVVSAWVHMDEAAPHIHFAFTPLLEGKLNAKQMVNKWDLKSLHQDMEKKVFDAFGFYLPLLLDEGDPLKTLSKLSQKDYIRARAATETIDRELAEKTSEVEQLQERSEYLRRSNDVATAAESLWEEKPTFGIDKYVERVQSLVEELRGRAEETLSRVQTLRERIRSSRGRIRSMGEIKSHLRGVYGRRSRDAGTRIEKARAKLSRYEDSVVEEYVALSQREISANKRNHGNSYVFPDIGIEPLSKNRGL